MAQLRQHISSALQTDPQSILVVGSAKLGFSLNPDSFPRPFTATSDVDVAVIDEALFDQIWTALLKWNYPRRYALMGVDLRWVRDRVNDLYWGWFRPHRLRFEGLLFPEELRPIRDISTSWAGAFRGLARLREFATRNVSGRLYRTRRHALLYHAEGLRQIRERLRGH